MSERERHRQIDYLWNAAHGVDPAEAVRARRVLVVADALAKVRRGDPHPCFCGWCAGPLSLDDITRAHELVGLLDGLR